MASHAGSSNHPLLPSVTPSSNPFLTWQPRRLYRNCRTYRLIVSKHTLSTPIFCPLLMPPVLTGCLNSWNGAHKAFQINFQLLECHTRPFKIRLCLQFQLHLFSHLLFQSPSILQPASSTPEYSHLYSFAHAQLSTENGSSPSPRLPTRYRARAQIRLILSTAPPLSSHSPLILSF